MSFLNADNIVGGREVGESTQDRVASRNRSRIGGVIGEAIDVVGEDGGS